MVSQSDSNEDKLQKQQQNVVKELLKILGNLLDQVEGALTTLESSNDLLGHVILKTCEELADAVESAAKQLDQQSDQDRRVLARTSLKDGHLELTVTTDYNGQDVPTSDASAQEKVGDSSATDSTETATTTTQNKTETEYDLLTVIRVVASLLHEVAATLRSIEANEADGIADAAVLMARSFLITLQSIRDTIDPTSLTTTSSSRELAADIEEEKSQESTNGRSSSPSSSSSSSSAREEWKRKMRIRALWPPLGPAVGQVLNWLKAEAMQQPLPAAALGLTMWPAAFLTAFFSTPLLLADGALQHLYQICQDHFLIQWLEYGVSQVYYTTRFTWLCVKLLGKLIVQVVSHQVEEHGGVGNMLQQAGNAAMHGVTHPMETVSMTWDGLVWGASALRDSWQFASIAASNEQRATVKAQFNLTL